MYCTNCGAKLKDREVRCPYCGDICQEAAEKEYMNQLDDILDDTKELANVSIEEYKDEISSRAKEAAKIFLIILFLVLLLIVGSILFRFYIYHFY